MDEDELQELRRDVVQTGKGYDTFGHAAAEQNRKANLSEQAQRPGLAALDLSNIIAPVPESLGMSCYSRQLSDVVEATSTQYIQSGLWSSQPVSGATQQKSFDVT